MKEIIIEIAPDGQITMRANGFAGPSCLSALQYFADILGVTVDATPTEEYWMIAQDTYGSPSIAINAPGGVLGSEDNNHTLGYM